MPMVYYGNAKEGILNVQLYNVQTAWPIIAMGGDCIHGVAQ